MVAVVEGDRRRPRPDLSLRTRIEENLIG